MNCPSPSDPENGKAYTIESGMAAVFVCNNGFITVGNPSSYCVDGNWSPPPPVCKDLEDNVDE